MTELPTIIFHWHENKYYFQFVEKQDVKNIGEIAIEISEISMEDILTMVEKIEDEYLSGEDLTEENIMLFSKLIFKELINKYSFHISFLIKNMFISFFNVFEYYQDNFLDEMIKIPDIKNLIDSGKLQILDVGKNLTTFISVILYFIDGQILPFKQYIEFLCLDNKAGTPEDIKPLINYLSETERMEYKIIMSENNEFIEKYTTGSILALLVFDLCNIMKNEVLIKHCANCDKYFTPQKRSDAIYCDRPSPQDNSMTCKDYGTKKLWYDRLKDNKSAKLYRNIYSAKQALAKRNPDIKQHQDDFDEYKIKSAQFKKDIKAGVKTDDEFITWLKSVRGKRYLD